MAAGLLAAQTQEKILLISVCVFSCGRHFEMWIVDV